MEYILKGKISKEDYADFNRAILLRKRFYLIFLSICFFILLLGAIFEFIAHPSIWNLNIQIWPIMFIILLYVVVLKARIKYSYEKDRTLQDEIILTLTEKGIKYESNRGYINYTTEDFGKIIIDKKVIVIYVSTNKAILIPKHFFSTIENELEVVSFIRETYMRK